MWLYPSWHLQASQQHPQLIGPSTSGSAGRSPGSCGAACVLPNDSTLLHILSGEKPHNLGVEYYSPSFSLCCNALLESQGPPDTSAAIASSVPCILHSSGPAHPHLTVSVACPVLSQEKGRPISPLCHSLPFANDSSLL